jgi:MFS family permease
LQKRTGRRKPFHLTENFIKPVDFGTFAAITTFLVLFMTVFTLSWATSDLGYSKRIFLLMQLFSVLFFAFFIPVSALIADRIGRRKYIYATTPSLFLVLPFLFLNSGSPVL